MCTLERLFSEARIFRIMPVLFLLSQTAEAVECPSGKEARFIADLSDEQLRSDDPDAYANAILCLGHLKSVAAVNSLIGLLEYRRSFTSQESFLRTLSQGIITRRVAYPAVEALADIGRPALPGVANVLAANDVGTKSYESAVAVFVIFFWDDREEGVGYLKKEAAGLHRTVVERDRLLAVAKILAPE